MAYCPECRTVYEQGVVACRTCRVPLLEGLPEAGQAGSGEAEWVNLAELREVPDPVTAAMWQGALESQGLHPRLRQNTVPMYGAVLRDWRTRSWGTLLVPADELAEARTVLDDFLATAEQGAPAEGEEVDGGAAPS